MADPLGVDTSLMGNQGTNADTGVPILDSPSSPFMSGDNDPFQQLQPLPKVSQADFTQAINSSDSPVSFTGGVTDVKGKRAEALKFAKSFLGVNYVWGGTSPSGFDCSGLVQYVWKKFGLNLPRVSQQQAGAGQRVAIKDLQPMDLVLMHNGPGGPGHVAFWLGNGMILEAPHTGAQVRIRRVGKNEGMFGVHLNV